VTEAADFFVSYTASDESWAEWIAWTLEEDGYQVLVHAWDFVPGSNWVQKMQEGVRDARRMVAVLSEDYLGSVYGSAEWQAAWAQDPAGADRQLLLLAATLSAHRLAAFGVHVLAALGGDDAGWRQEFRLCRCRGDRR